jgi:hypothetical protein
MTSWIVLVVAIFSATPGEPPTPYTAVLLPGVVCNDDLAKDFVLHLTNGKQAKFAYSCDHATEPVTMPVVPTAPFKSPFVPKHLPGDKEA